MPSRQGEDAVSDEAVEAWHWALLGLAGYLPDELVSEARFWLAAGLRLDIAQAVAFAVTAGQLAAGGGELRLVRDELAATGQDGDLVLALDALPDAERLPSAWEFRSADPAANGPGAALPLDLTGAPDPGGFDVTERAIVEATRVEPAALGLWRSWRVPAGGAPWPPPKQVFVVSAGPPPTESAPPGWSTADLATLAARLGEALLAAGEADPQVEVCPSGVEAPPYQVLARHSGALLWAREPATDVTVARVFDEVDPVAGPRFAADRPRIDDPGARARLLAWLDAGHPVLGTSTRMADVVVPDRGEVVPMTFRTDGRWVWTDTAAYYLDQHGIVPDPDLLRYIAADPYPRRVDEVALHRVLTHLLGPAPEESVWVVPQMDAPLHPDPA